MAAVLTHTAGASPEDVLARLSQVDVLRALPPEEILDVVGSVRRLDVPRGTRVITQGEIGDALYFIESGKARVTHNGSIELGVKGPGDVFGEMALLTGETRTATVTAETALVLWRVPRDDFERVVAA
ncbi:MAG: cyclic nucleotide-binding domain-containing protein, partial [Chloroflexota bacterium]